MESLASLPMPHIGPSGEPGSLVVLIVYPAGHLEASVDAADGVDVFATETEATERTALGGERAVLWTRNSARARESAGDRF